MAEANRLFERAISLLDTTPGLEGAALLKDCLALNPAHSHAARMLAAIATASGLETEGRQIMEAFFAEYPGQTLRAGQLGKLPALLKLRGFSGTRVIPWRTEGRKISTRFRGGHFTTKFLISDPGYPEHRYTIAGGNILRPGALPEFAVMLNTIADPDVESETLTTLQEYLAAHPDTSILNAPDKVLRTTRDANYRRLRNLPRVRFPETHRVVFAGADANAVAARMSQLGLDGAPVILRATGTHTARTTALIRNRADLDAYLGGGRLDGPHYLIRYIELLWNRAYFRKCRLFWIDGAFYPTVCHIDRVWNVHGGNRKEVMRGDTALMDEEKRFLLDWRAYVGAANAEVLDRLGEQEGLEFFGIDFNFDEDGLLIYEMNPAMRHSFDHAEHFAYKMPFDLAITQAFSGMVNRRLGL